MGNTTGNNSVEVELNQLKLEMSSFQKRLAGLEKDLPKLGVNVTRCNEKVQENSNALLNINLLEEGRSVYKRRPKRHTGSSYK